MVNAGRPESSDAGIQGGRTHEPVPRTGRVADPFMCNRPGRHLAGSGSGIQPGLSDSLRYMYTTTHTFRSQAGKDSEKSRRILPRGRNPIEVGGHPFAVRHGSRPAGPVWNPDPFDFVLKIVPSFPRSDGHYRNWFSDLPRDRQVTIFNKRTEHIAFNAEVTHPEILAIAIAHELGHALLGPKSHSDAGIMRPRMQPEDFKKAQCLTLAFTPEQAERMRRQVVQLMTRKQGTTP